MNSLLKFLLLSNLIEKSFLINFIFLTQNKFQMLEYTLYNIKCMHENHPVFATFMYAFSQFIVIFMEGGGGVCFIFPESQF